MLGCKQILSIIVGFRVRCNSAKRRPTLCAPAGGDSSQLRTSSGNTASTGLALSALTVVNLPIARYVLSAGGAARFGQAIDVAWRAVATLGHSLTRKRIVIAGTVLR
jgi:hypothetical protein